MVAYGLAVTAGLVGVTILGVKMYEKLKAKISRYEKYIPKISGIVLLILAFGLLLS
jgi:cytochrome c biogenesis protein CcdA